MPTDPNRVRDVFLSAVELPPEQRTGFLADACGGDADLRAEVDRLLAANADPDSILEPASPTLTLAGPALVLGHPATLDLPGGTSATDAPDPEAPIPTTIAPGEHRPEGATPTLAGADPDATSATAATAPSPLRRQGPDGRSDRHGHRRAVHAASM